MYSTWLRDQDRRGPSLNVPECARCSFRCMHASIFLLRDRPGASPSAWPILWKVFRMTKQFHKVPPFGHQNASTSKENTHRAQNLTGPCRPAAAMVQEPLKSPVSASHVHHVDTTPDGMGGNRQVLLIPFPLQAPFQTMTGNFKSCNSLSLYEKHFIYRILSLGK